VDTAIQHIINAVSLGSLYALLALGIALIFGIMRLVNFAHGELVMVTGYSLLLLSYGSPLLVVPMAVAAAVITALLMERAAFRPVRGESPATLLVTSFALSFLLQSVALFVFGARSKSVELPDFVVESVSVGDIRIAKLDLVTVLVALVALAGLAGFFKLTRLGVQMRAAAEDFLMTRLVGVSADRVIASAFGLGGLLAGIAGVLFVARLGTLTPIMGLTPLIVGVVATVMGGMGSLVGAVLGGYLLGLSTIALQVLLPMELQPFRDAFVFAAVIAVLVLRPQGLVPSTSAQSRV
jgi:branched-chain amino acid transport system permease protein